MEFFLQDPTYNQLICAFDKSDTAGAFRAAHTLKGLSRDMGFTPLAQAAAQLTESLRPGADGAPCALERAQGELLAVSQAYEQVRSAAELAF